MGDETESRAGVLSQVSDWLKLLALIVLATEALLTAVVVKTGEPDPYIALGLTLLGLIVVGVFFDRYLQSRSSALTEGGAATASKAAAQGPVDLPAAVEKREFDYQDVASGIAYLAQELRRKKPDLVVAVDRGGAIVGGMLTKRLLVPLRLINRAAEGENFHCELDIAELKGKTVVLVDDCSRTGSTLKAAKQLLERKFAPAELIAAVLLLAAPSYKSREAKSYADLAAYTTKRIDSRMPWDV